LFKYPFCFLFLLAMVNENNSVIDDVVSKLVVGTSSLTHMGLATKIAERSLGLQGLDLTHSSLDPRTFSVGEFCPRFALGENGRDLNGKHVYLVMIPSPDEDQEGIFYRAAMASQAAKENGADKVVILATDFPHGRQDRGPGDDDKAKGELTTVRLHARTLLGAGCDQVITTHEHSSRISGYFALESGLIHRERPDLLEKEARSIDPKYVKVPEHVDIDDPEVQALGRKVFKSISPHTILADYLLHQSSLVGTDYLENGGARLLVKSVDKGNRVFIDPLTDALWLPNLIKVYCGKARDAKNDPNKVEVGIEEVIGEFTSFDGMMELLGDDGGDTLGTLRKTAAWSDKGNLCSKTGKFYGVPEGRIIYCTHPWLAGKSYDAIQRRIVNNIGPQEFLTTNTRPYVGDHQYYKLKETSTVLRLAGLWADAILANELGHDVMSRYANFSCEEEQHRFISPLYVLKRHTRHFMAEDSRSKKEINFELRG
jgi:phosphoribosylpyrophosphate synthetase